MDGTRQQRASSHKSWAAFLVYRLLLGVEVRVGARVHQGLDRVSSYPAQPDGGIEDSGAFMSLP